jgi:hypothetical protein
VLTQPFGLTSSTQLDSRFGTLTGTREGDKFIGHDGVVLHSDTNAADNILMRMGDVEIPRYLKHEKAKIILLERTQKFLDTLTLSWDEVFEAIPDTDKSQTLEPKDRKSSKVNQGVNAKQLTLFNYD